MKIHFGESFDGTENYTDSVDMLPCDIIRYAIFEARDEAHAVRIARLNIEHTGAAYCIQIGETFEEGDARAAGAVA